MIAGKIGVVARGHSLAEVDGKRIRLQAGDMLVVEPGERHTFIESFHDYLHFVVQAPFTPGDKVSEPFPPPDRILG
jgi:quercetin dioxygenase-like cupin family protein